MKIIKFFFQHSRSSVLMSLTAGIVSGACNAALLAVINMGLKNTHASHNVIWAFVGLCLLLPLTRYTAEILLSSLGQGALFRLRMQLCRQMLAAPLYHLEEIGPARLLTALTDDVPTITNAIGSIPLLCVNLALVVGCLVYMGTLSWILLTIVLGFMVFGIISYQLPILMVNNVFGQARKEANTLQSHFRALTQGTKELKIHHQRRQAFIADSLEGTSGAIQRYNLAGFKIYAAAASWGQTLVFVVVGLIVFLLPHLRQITGPTLTAYAITLLYLMTPLQVVMNLLPQVSRANIALKTVRELGFTLVSKGSEEVAEVGPVTSDWDKLELRGVTRSYRREGEDESFVLGPINLTLKPGELVFITGGNGSGKTTLAKLLMALYPPESGTIYFQNQPVGPENQEFYRQHFSAVFSDFFLFDQLLGLLGPELDEQARKYLEQLKLSNKVQIKEGKFSTTDLSQGQRKRLALLTAYLEDRPIYVFDEWAADQDPYFKNIFYTQLLPALKARNKTVLVISHDDRYYYVADRIIKLDDGQIVSDQVVSEQPAVMHTVAR
jgi:putative pyoverdin transport system ATP-binding/permease protein